MKFQRDDRDQDFEQLNVVNGVVKCPAGYPLRQIDQNTWRCDGGNHEYHFDSGDIVFDKFGGVMVKAKPGADKKENGVN